MTKRGELPVDVMGSGTAMGAFIRCPMHIAARFEWIRGVGSRPVWSCNARRPRAGCHGDCGISAEVVTGGDIAQDDTVESSDLRGYAAEESESRRADRPQLASVH